MGELTIEGLIGEMSEEDMDCIANSDEYIFKQLMKDPMGNAEDLTMFLLTMVEQEKTCMAPLINEYAYRFYIPILRHHTREELDRRYVYEYLRDIALHMLNIYIPWGRKEYFTHHDDILHYPSLADVKKARAQIE
jgi:hypothetical protein